MNKQEQTKTALADLHEAKQRMATELLEVIAGHCDSFSRQYGISIESIEVGFIDTTAMADALPSTAVGMVNVTLDLPSI